MVVSEAVELVLLGLEGFGFGGKFVDLDEFLEFLHVGLFGLEEGVALPLSIELVHLGLDRGLEDFIDGVELEFLLVDHPFGIDFGFVVDGGPSRFLDHPEQFGGLQVDDLRDAPLLHQEVGVFDVEVRAPEEVLHFGEIRGEPVDEELGHFVLGDLAGDQQLLAVLVPGRPHVLVGASELDGDGGLADAGAIGDQLDQAGTGESKHFLAGAAEEKLDGIEDVALA